MTPLGVHHVAIKTHRVGRLARFYADTLRLEETHRHVDEQGLRSVWLKSESLIVMIERSETAAAPRTGEGDPPGFHLLALRIRVEDREDWRAHLSACGSPVIEETAFTLYLRDPENNRIGLSTWPEPSTA